MKPVTSAPTTKHPKTPPVTPAEERWPYWVALGFAVVVLAACTAVAMSHRMPGWEQHIFTSINGHQTAGWVANHVAKPLSNAVWGMVGLVFVALLIPKYRPTAWRYAVPVSVTFVVGFVIEHLVNRARPIGLVHDVVLRASQGGPGFPSGHVATLTALGVTIWPLLSWPWRIVVALFIVGEAWSRIFLGVHAPLDVVGGFAVGLGVVAFIKVLPQSLRVALHLD